MPISLAKGQKINLTKDNPGLKKILVGLGWDTNRYDGGHDFDLDVSVFMTGANGKCSGEKDFIFYNHKEHASGAVIHMGDNRTGDGNGDDEHVKVDLSKVPAEIEKIAFTVTIDQADTRGQNFGMVSNAYCRIVNEDNGEELMRFDLGEDASIETAVIMAELYRHDGEWKFNAIGSGYQGGLAALCTHFGLEV